MFRIPRSKKRTDSEVFFARLPDIFPKATTLYLEGAMDKDVRSCLEPFREDSPYRPPRMTWWSFPREERCGYVFSEELSRVLTKLAANHAEPEICTHLFVYEGDQTLFGWPDAFGNDAFVSERVDEDKREELASILHSSCDSEPVHEPFA